MAKEIIEFLHTKIGIVYFFLLITLLLLSLRQIKKNWRIKRWQRSLNLQQHSLVFHQLYKDVDGFKLSRQARHQHDALEYVYGEIEFLPFIALLSLAKPNNDTVFYDLGCGTGKAVFACALVYPVKKSVGVELLPQLYFSACNQIKKLDKIKDHGIKTKKIEFIQGDFLEVNLNEATFIFINSTGLFSPTWEALCSRLNKLPNLNTVITTSKPLLSTDFSMIISTKIQMSWGVVLAYIHHRKTNFH